MFRSAGEGIFTDKDQELLLIVPPMYFSQLSLVAG